MVLLPRVSSLRVKPECLAVLWQEECLHMEENTHISLGRWLYSVTPGACFSCVLSESSCLEGSCASSSLRGEALLG